MDRARLRAVLAGGSSITFDGRPRALVEKGELQGEGFFASRLMRNLVLVKLVEPSDSVSGKPTLQTLLYFPYDPLQVGDGGASLAYSRDQFRMALGRNFGAENLDE